MPKIRFWNGIRRKAKAYAERIEVAS